jgi:hypothetical protein
MFNRQMDNRRSEKLNSAFSSGELKIMSKKNVHIFCEIYSLAAGTGVLVLERAWWHVRHTRNGFEDCCGKSHLLPEQSLQTTMPHFLQWCWNLNVSFITFGTKWSTSVGTKTMSQNGWSACSRCCSRIKGTDILAYNKLYVKTSQ